MLVIFRGLPIQRCYSNHPTLCCLVVKHGWPRGLHEWYTLYFDSANTVSLIHSPICVSKHAIMIILYLKRSRTLNGIHHSIAQNRSVPI